MSAPSEQRARHVSSFHLEALRLGVASPEERAWVSSHQASCARCAALAETLDGYRQEFARGAQPRRPLVAVSAPAPAPVPVLGRIKRWWMAGAVLAPLAAAAAWIAVDRTALTTSPPGEPDILEKGGPSLGIVARRGSRVFPVRSGERVRPGDQIRFVLKGVNYPYGLIASVDGAGKPNIYVPYEGSASARLTPGDRLEMEGSIVLDTRLGPERIFALFSREPLAADAVREALATIGGKGEAAIRGTSALQVAADAQSSVLLEKVAP
jgi:hypothetical protein